MSQPILSDFARDAGLTEESLRHIMAGNNTRKIKFKEKQEPIPTELPDKNAKKIKKKQPSSSNFSVPALFYRPCFSESDIDDITLLLSQKSWSTPSELTEQIQDYKKFLANPCLSPEHLCKFYEFYTIVGEQGGIMQSLANDNFSKAVTDLSKRYLLEVESIHDYFLLYKFFILNYEMYAKQQKKQYCPCNIGYPQILPLRIYHKARDQEEDVLRRDCLQIQQFLSKIPQKMQQEFIKKEYGSQQVETTIQFCHSRAILSPQLYLEKGRRSISEYYAHQHRCEQAFRQGKPLNVRQIDIVQSATNISTLTKPDVNYAIRKTLSDQPELQYLSNQDLLSYMDYMLDGFNIPSLSIRARDSWTGCQQQPFSFCSACLSHGPGQNQWFVLHQNYFSDLRQEVKKQFGIDIMKQQSWYPDVKWFILRNYPIKKVVQREGDLMFFGAGSVRWSRTLSPNTTSTWSIVPKTEFQLHMTQKRIKLQQQNSSLHIPIKTLILRWFNHEYHAFDSQFIEQIILQWVEEEEKQFENIKMKPQDATCIYIFDQDAFCSICKRQIFLFFVMTSKLHCLKCCKKNEREMASTKFRLSDVKLLLYRNKTYRQTRILNEVPQVLELCHGQFAGYISYCWQNKRCYSASNILIQQTRKVQRINRLTNQEEDLMQLKSRSPKHIIQKQPKGQPKPLFHRVSQLNNKQEEKESDIDKSVEISNVSRSRSRKRREQRSDEEFKKPKDVKRRSDTPAQQSEEAKESIKEEPIFKQEQKEDDKSRRKPSGPILSKENNVIPVVYPDPLSGHQHFGIFAEMRAKNKISQQKFTDVVPVIPPNNLKEPYRPK